MKRPWGICCLLLALAAAGAAFAADSGTASPVRQDFPTGGASLVLPAGFQPQRLAEQYEIVSAVRRDAQGKVDLAVTLAALPVQPETKLADFAETVLTERNGAVRKLQRTQSGELTVAGQPAFWQRVEYTYRGQPRTADQVFVLADVPGVKEFRLGYLLTVEANPAAVASLDEVRKSVTASLRFIPLKHPAEMPITRFETVQLPTTQVAAQVPAGWTVETSDGYIKAYACDYLAGGLPYPMLTIDSEEIDAAMTAQEEAELSIQVARTLWGKEAVTVLEQGAATLLGQGAWQVTMRTKENDKALVATERCTMRQGTRYVVTVTMQADSPAQAKALLETLAARVSVRPQSQTAPATESTPVSEK